MRNLHFYQNENGHLNVP